MIHDWVITYLPDIPAQGIAGQFGSRSERIFVDGQLSQKEAEDRVVLTTGNRVMRTQSKRILVIK